MPPTPGQAGSAALAAVPLAPAATGTARAAGRRTPYIAGDSTAAITWPEASSAPDA